MKTSRFGSRFNLGVYPKNKVIFNHTQIKPAAGNTILNHNLSSQSAAQNYRTSLLVIKSKQRVGRVWLSIWRSTIFALIYFKNVYFTPFDANDNCLFFYILFIKDTQIPIFSKRIWTNYIVLYYLTHERPTSSLKYNVTIKDSKRFVF